ncbi:murein L,D-transpeptidase catalytic domain family protein [Cetobacterium sp. SF1]|uniref:murein L,D-transpeptidase catalytic domain family protein n=1 Tax=unclassified Cetobacterium TaxID=2630983 RepID=UPI003CE8135A
MKKFAFILSIIMSSFTYALDTSDTLYKEMKLENYLNKDVFNMAIKGFNKIKDRRNNILTIIDYTKPSTEKRFLVLDLDKKTVLYDTYVTHGKNSGKIMAINFSNTMNSYKSSLGFFLTERDGYMGSNGYSLRMKGLEPGINSNAFARNIVIHGADYAKPEYMTHMGFLGRSLGCPSVPTELSHPIIDTIKDKTVLFIIGNDDKYLSYSNLIK